MSAASQTHHHIFLGADHQRNERRVWMVIALTATMMVAEIAAGSYFGSMALTADGWHMATHASAMLIAALAYLFARRRAHDPRFTFGTGKLGDLAGFASAVLLALIAVLIGWESAVRLVAPVDIAFSQAIAVAVIGLAVNLFSALLLKGDHGHHHDHDHHHHGHDHHHHHGDNNFRAVYLHVLADALTSVLAIVALVAGRSYGWLWLDPLMGIVGAAVIAQWSWGLIRHSGAVLVDAAKEGEALSGEIRRLVSRPDDEITDLHVWQVGPGHFAAIVALASQAPLTPAGYKALLAPLETLSHVTVEVTPLAA